LDRKCTRHDCCSFGNSHHCSKVEAALLNLHGLPLSLVLVVLVGTTSLVLLVLLLWIGTFIGIVPDIPTVVTFVVPVIPRRW
jgi:hypothetical protein